MTDQNAKEQGSECGVPFAEDGGALDGVLTACPNSLPCPNHSVPEPASGQAGELTAEAEARSICRSMDDDMERMLGGNRTTAHYDAGVPRITAALSARDQLIAELRERIDYYIGECNRYCATIASQSEEIAHLQSQAGADSCADYVVRNGQQAEEIARLRDYYRSVITEPCSDKEKHCTCVPALRQRIAELENSGTNALVRFLIDYVNHQGKCDANLETGDGCTCGLTSLLRRAQDETLRYRIGQLEGR